MSPIETLGGGAEGQEQDEQGDAEGWSNNKKANGRDQVWRGAGGGVWGGGGGLEGHAVAKGRGSWGVARVKGGGEVVCGQSGCDERQESTTTQYLSA